MPNIFYRVELEWGDRAVRGVSIPGLPGVLIGASNDVAWGATVSNADQSDWVVVEVDPADPSRYLTPDGYEPFTNGRAEIVVRGGSPVALETRATRWGPVVAEDWLGRPLALHATWLEPQGLDLDIVGLAEAADAASASVTLARWAGPSLNWVLADRGGEIAWVVNGPLPRRVGDAHLVRPSQAGHNEAAIRLFLLLQRGLKTLEMGERSPDLLTSYLLKLADVVGVAPSLLQCATCGRVDGLHRFSFGSGGSICDTCSIEGTVKLRDGLTEYLAALASSELTSLPPPNLTFSGEAMGIARRFVEYHLDRKLTSLAVME